MGWSLIPGKGVDFPFFEYVLKGFPQAPLSFLPTGK
jgi:hypothetical protein